MEEEEEEEDEKELMEQNGVEVKMVKRTGAKVALIFFAVLMWCVNWIQKDDSGLANIARL